MYLVHGHTAMITVTRYPKIAQVELLKVSELKVSTEEPSQFPALQESY